MKIGGFYIEILSLCNLKCKHCYNSSGISKERLDIESIQHIADYVKSNDVEGLSISGGEPFLHPNIDNIVHLLVSTNAKVSIVTNATMIPEDMISKWSSEGILDKLLFQVSLDGSCSEDHDFLRGEGAYNKLLNGLDILSRNKAKYFFHSVIHKKNYNHLENIIYFANKLHNTRVDFALLKIKGRGIDNYELISLNVSEQIDTILRLKQLKEKNNINIPSVFYGVCPIFRDPDERSFIRIDATGNVFPCQNFNNPESSLGNIHNEKISEIVSNQNMNLLYKKICNFRSEANKCKKCALNGYCQLGCLGVEFCEEFKYEYSNDCLLRKEYFKKMVLESGVTKNVEKKS